MVTYELNKDEFMNAILIAFVKKYPQVAGTKPKLRVKVDSQEFYSKLIVEDHDTTS